jgi:hypothetical protein
VTADARLALEGVAKNVATPAPNPLTPVEIGRPVQFVRVPDAGVPSAGVTNVKLVNDPDAVPENVGLVNVLFVRVSDPASVASVPVVGNVTLVAPVNVMVSAYPPEIVRSFGRLRLPPVVVRAVPPALTTTILFPNPDIVGSLSNPVATDANSARIVEDEPGAPVAGTAAAL